MWLLEMSISAGVLILILTFLRRGGFWSPAKRTIMVLWMVVLARLLLPCSLPIRRGIAAPVFGLVRRVCSLRENMTENAGGIAAIPVPKAASFGTADAAGTGLLQQAAGWLWLAGMIGVSIYFVYSFLQEYQLLSQALPLESILDGISENAADDGRKGAASGAVQKSDVYAQILEACETACRLAGMRPQKKAVRMLVHDRIRSPLVFGIVRQKIVLPKSLLYLGQAQMQHILTHEMVHIRRHDNLWKLLSAAAVCIHWFNPAVWLMYILSARDLELSCDEQVLSVHGSQGRQEYAMTLLTLAQNQKGTILFCSGFLENPVKERMEAIMKYRKLTGMGVLCAVMLFAGASSVFATNEQAAYAQDAEEAVLVDASGIQNESVQADAPGTLKEYEEVDALRMQSENIQADASGADTQKEAEYYVEDGIRKVEVKNEEDETLYVEFHPDVEIKEGESILVKFDSPVYADNSNGWREFAYSVDENGITHIHNGAGEELVEGRIYNVD